MASELASGDLIALLVDASLKSLVFGLAADIGLRALRVKDAALSHSIWVAIAVGMLLFPALRMYMPGVTVPLMPEGLDVDRTYHVVDPKWAPTLLGVYAGGVLALLVRLLVGVWTASRLVMRSRPVDDPSLERLVRIGLPARLWRSAPAICESEDIRVPVTIGFARPRVLLPMRWREWSSDKVASVIAHEVAHVRRSDFAWQIVAELNACFFWFHPIAWMLRNRLSLAAERACDDSAILTIGDHCLYARHLVDIAGEVRASGGRVAFGLPMAKAHQVRSRVESILDRNRRLSGRLRRGGAVFVAVLASVAWLSAAGICWQRSAADTEVVAPTAECPSAAAGAPATQCPESTTRR